jgi:RNA polymerase sigma factor for flagellar operon FliA
MVASAHAPRADANALVEEHLYLVQHVVNQVAVRYPRHVDRQELWAAGAAGLVDASRRYDPLTGVPFARYASIRIRGAIIDSTRSRDWATRSLRRRARELSEAARELEQSNGHTPTVAELASTLGVSQDEVRDRQAACERATLLQLDQAVADGDGGVETLEATLPEDDPTLMPDDALEERELIGSMRVAVEHLDEPHRTVVQRYYFGGELLQEIALDLGVTEARVSQVCSEAVTAMRAWMATRFEGIAGVAPRAPGARRRAAYVASMQSHVSWRDCLVAADAPWATPVGA